MVKKPDQKPVLTKEQVLAFLNESQKPLDKKELARIFGIKGSDRAKLNEILRKLRKTGEVNRERNRLYTNSEGVPSVGVIEIMKFTADGNFVARYVGKGNNTNSPNIFLPYKKIGPQITVGDRILAKIKTTKTGKYTAQIIKRLEQRQTRLIGVFKTVLGKGRIIPVSRKIKREFIIEKGQEKNAKDGDLVEGIIGKVRKFGVPIAKVKEVLGTTSDTTSQSLISIHLHEIPMVFSKQSLKEAASIKSVTIENRIDLRGIPFVTVDDDDARDFDDAVWAERYSDREIQNGWHLIVAIADVAYYVKTGSSIDHSAYERGNSVYFPDRVVPMLPEALSNDICSLVPGKDRGCIAAHIWLTAEGEIHKFQFVRGLMRSTARLTYIQLQEAQDGKPDRITCPLRQTVIEPLYGAFEALAESRKRRKTIDIDIPERRIIFDGKNQIVGIRRVQRLNSHRLIEEFMIAANVAAAIFLEQSGIPCMYRVHDQPSEEKLITLKNFLSPFGINLANSKLGKTEIFGQILTKASNTNQMDVVNMAILRAQSQAEYSPINIGHFGLGLLSYAHFTSPIRRYSDLIVHRAIISALEKKKFGSKLQKFDELKEVGKHISYTERRAVLAERDSMDRYKTIFLSKNIGTTFQARVNGVNKAGLFITLINSGADGLIPLSFLGNEQFQLWSTHSELKGKSTGKLFKIGDKLNVRLERADINTGSLAFSIASDKHRKN